MGELGRGGMAVVYLVRERATGQQHALKVLHAHLREEPRLGEASWSLPSEHRC